MYRLFFVLSPWRIWGLETQVQQRGNALEAIMSVWKTKRTMESTYGMLMKGVDQICVMNASDFKIAINPRLDKPHDIINFDGYFYNSLSLEPWSSTRYYSPGEERCQFLYMPFYDSKKAFAKNSHKKAFTGDRVFVWVRQQHGSGDWASDDVVHYRYGAARTANYLCTGSQKGGSPKCKLEAHGERHEEPNPKKTKKNSWWR